MRNYQSAALGNPYMGESYYSNPYVKPNMWDDQDKWSSKARRWAMGWLECEEEEKNTKVRKDSKPKD